MNKMKKWLSSQFNRIKSNSFIKSILTLSAGVVVSQSISLLTTPIVSRIYDPEVLGDFSIITSNARIIGEFVCLGLMTAIMVPKENDEAKGLCRLLATSIIGLTTLLLLIAFAISGTWRMFSVNLDYRVACLILWLYIVLSNVSSVCYAYVNRQKMYKVLFWNPTIGTVANATVSIVLGLLGCGLWGYACGNLLALVLNIVHMLRRVNPFKGKIAREYRALPLLKKHKDFPLYQLPANFIGTFSQQMPVQLIKRFFGSAILGSYSMCLTILGIPSKFLSAPVNRVYYQEATSRYNRGEDIGEFSYKILETNIRIAIIPISILIVFGKPLFTLVLGEKWMQAGSFATVIGVYQLVQFCRECLSGNYVIIKKQKLNLVFSSIDILLNFAVFNIGLSAFGEIFPTLILYVIVGVLYKLIDLGLFLYYTGITMDRYLRFVGLYIFLPALLATMVRIVLNLFGFSL